jgi:hypothetical protein
LIWVIVALDFVQRTETMPLEMVTVLPWSTNVTAGLVPLTTAPGTFALRRAAPHVRKMQNTAKRIAAFAKKWRDIDTREQSCLN